MTSIVKVIPSSQTLRIQITCSLLEALDVAQQFTVDECSLWHKGHPANLDRLTKPVDFSVTAVHSKIASIAHNRLNTEGLSSAQERLWTQIRASLRDVVPANMLVRPVFADQSQDTFYVIDWDNFDAVAYDLAGRVMRGPELHPIFVSGYLDYYTYVFLQSLGIGVYQAVRPGQARTVMVHPYFNQRNEFNCEEFEETLTSILECDGSADDIREFELLYSPRMLVPVSGLLSYSQLEHLRVVLDNLNTEDSSLPDCTHLRRLVSQWLFALKDSSY